MGVSLGGSDLSVDNNADSMLYGRFGVTPTDVVQGRGLGMRPEVQQLVDDLNARSRPATVAAPAAVLAAQPPLIPAVPVQVVPVQPVAPRTPLPPNVVNPPLVPIR